MEFEQIMKDCFGGGYMKNKVAITEHIKNFESEISNKVDWLEVHLFEMRNEIFQIEEAAIILEVINGEISRKKIEKEAISYSSFRTTIYQALPYRIIMGLSKICVGKNEFSLLKTVNVISQMDEYKNNVEVKKNVKNVLFYIESNEFVRTIATYRDQFFGHLDRVSVISDLRINPTYVMKNIKLSDIEEIKKLIINLYDSCFKTKLDVKNQMASSEKIIDALF